MAENLYLRPPAPKVDVEALQRGVEEMQTLRLEAKELARSGHPGVRAEGKRAVQECNENLAWLRAQLAKEAPDAVE